MINKKYDGFLFGNGLSVNLFDGLKQKIPVNLYSLLNIDAFLMEFCEDRNEEIGDYIFGILYKGMSIDRAKFQKLKQEIKRYYISGGNSNIEYEFGNRHFWSEGYYVSTVGLNEATIKKYIQEQ